MRIQFFGGSADKQWHQVSLPLPDIYSMYDPDARKVDWYELIRNADGTPSYYQYMYSTD